MKVVVQYKQRKCKKCQQKLVYDSNYGWVCPYYINLKHQKQKENYHA